MQTSQGYSDAISQRISEQVISRSAHVESTDNSTFFPGVWEVSRILSSKYKTSRLGNKKHPLDELAYIILSIQTSETKYQQVFRNFKRRFPRWSTVAEASDDEISRAIFIGGLSRQKAKHLRQIVSKLKTDFGEISLGALRNMTTEEAEKYLCSLPGVGIKTARCVLMYSLGKPVFPVDIHCLRIMSRLGWIKCTGETSKEISSIAQRGDEKSEQIAAIAQTRIPPELRYSLHVRFVQHGRLICRPRPQCGVCVLSHICPKAGANRFQES